MNRLVGAEAAAGLVRPTALAERNSEVQPRTSSQASSDVAQLFEEQAARRPDSVAFILGDQRLTYRELNQRANRLAHYLAACGARRDTLVAVCLTRSLEMIVTLLAIVKAGGAYVPLDPDYPRERLAFMLDDTAAPILVTNETCADALPPNRARVVSIEHDASAIAACDSHNLGMVIGPHSLIYVVYTSGSTGRPKGVMVEHRGVARLVKDADYASFDGSERFLQLAPLAFDASTFEIWGPLLNGGSLVMMPPGTPSLESLVETIRQHRVTTIFVTTALFNLMMDNHRAGDLGSLRQLLAGGEVASPGHFRKALEVLPGCSVIHCYGPTENTTFTTCLRLRREHVAGRSVPIGYPIAGTQVWLLDSALNPVGPGAEGELHIGGEGLARCYLNQPNLTAQKFIVPPWARSAAMRLYRSGDLARYGEHGAIEFIGRVDDQVKISGHRVEPGEIASVLREHGGIRDAVVIAAHELDSHKRLIAYVVPRSHSGPDSHELRAFLQAKLPHFMVPAAFVTLDTIPLTHNGKIDRGALPRPARHAVVPPPPTSGGNLEDTIAGVWRQVLRLDAVGLHDNFFELGGDSLQLISVHSKLQKLVEGKFSVTELFEFPTVAELAEHLGSSGAEADSAPTEDTLARARRQREMLARRSQSPKVT